MGIISTAKSLYAENEGRSMLGSVGGAAKAHIGAALHPTNMIGKTFGFGSFIHTLARRKIGEPDYEPGGVKNQAKSSIRSKNKSKGNSTTKKTPTGNPSVPDKVVGTQLERIEENTRETTSILYKMVDGQDKEAMRADYKDAFDEENASEQNRLFASIGDKIAKLSVAPAGNKSDVKGTGFMDVFKGMGLERIAEFILGSTIAGLIAGTAMAFVKGVGKAGLIGLAVSLFAAIGDGVITAFQSGDLFIGIHKTFEDISWALGGMFSADELIKIFAAPVDALVKSITGAIWFVQDSVNWALKKLGLKTDDERSVREQRQIAMYKGSSAHGRHNPKGQTGFIETKSSSTQDIGGRVISPLGKITPSSAPMRGTGAVGTAPTIGQFTVGGAGGELVGQSEKTTGASIVKGLTDRGFSQDEAIAIAGNMGHESAGFQTGIKEYGTAPGKGGIGLMQWTGPRRRALLEFAKRRNGSEESWTDLNTQLDFTAHELRGAESSNFTKAMQGSSIADKTVGFRKYVERAGVPADGARIKYAQAVASEVGRSPSTALQAPASPKLDVATPTAALMATNAKVSASRQETDLTAATPIVNQGDTIVNNSTASIGMPPTSGDSIDDFVAKVLVAMGAITQT